MIDASSITGGRDRDVSNPHEDKKEDRDGQDPCSNTGCTCNTFVYTGGLKMHKEIIASLRMSCIRHRWLCVYWGEKNEKKKGGGEY